MMKTTDTDLDNQKSSAAMSLSDVAQFQGLDSGLLEKLENLETKILYRSYYFQGGLPKKFVNGVGTDTENIHYDGFSEERDLFSAWNPRYLDEYIEQAKQYGFHKHFLYYDGNNVNHITFADATIKFNHVDQNTDPNTFYGLISGLEFMNKMNSFI